MHMQSAGFLHPLLHLAYMPEPATCAQVLGDDGSASYSNIIAGMRWWVASIAVLVAWTCPHSPNLSHPVSLMHSGR